MLLQRQLEVSQATIDSLNGTISELRFTVEDLKKTVKSLEQALKDKGVETARVRKALKNVAAIMEKHSKRQQPSHDDPIDEEFTSTKEKPKYAQTMLFIF